MARLHEFEAKALFAEAGIPTPPGKIVASAVEASAAGDEIGYPVVLKAQVRAGGRGKAGGIRFADDRAAATAAAVALLGSSLHGHAVDRLLVERKLDIEREHYLGVFSNPAIRAPTLIFAEAGGVDVEEALARGDGVATMDIDLIEGVRPYMTLDMLRKAGVKGATLMPLALIATRLFEVYRRYDCTIAEINPVALTERGAMAVDARISIDDDALFRHPELGLEASEEVGDRPPTAFERIAARIDAHDHRGSAHFVQIDPDGSLAAAEGKVSIGFDGVGTGVSLATMDELVPLGFLPMNFCDTSGNPTASKLYRITRVILSQPGIEGYVFVSCLSSQQLDNTARGIVKAFKELYRETGGQPNLPCVLCFRGAWDETALAMFEQHGIAKGRWVRLLGRDATERDVALAFRNLHAEWRCEREGVRA
jgi:succinyl-CoA synthetase beta subunit